MNLLFRMFIFNKQTEYNMLLIVVLCLEMFRSPLAAVAAPVMTTDGQPKNQNCHCGHRTEVIKSDQAVVYIRPGHCHIHSTVVTDSNPAPVYTRAGLHDRATEVTDAKHVRCPYHYNQPQQSTPSPVDNTVTEDMSAYDRWVWQLILYISYIIHNHIVFSQSWILAG